MRNKTELTEGDKVLFRVIPTLFFCFPLSHVVEVFLKHLLMFGTSFWRDIWLQGGRRENPVAGNVQFLVPPAQSPLFSSCRGVEGPICSDMLQDDRCFFLQPRRLLSPLAK